MTIEVAKQRLLNTAWLGTNEDRETTEEAVRVLIKAVEQKPILDKIIAEMEELIEWHDCPIELDGGNDAWYCEAVKQCVEIIDKYRQEGEE